MVAMADPDPSDQASLFRGIEERMGMPPFIIPRTYFLVLFDSITCTHRY